MSEDLKPKRYLARVDTSAPPKWFAIVGIGYRLTALRASASKMTAQRIAYAARSMGISSYSLETTEN